jgi:prepilin-type N-terminal cleavage/methylation domain-containing protein/prepilin-type processing-associated H-X9-DG protein
MRSAGFTLIELLVVISVVALVAALLFPAFSSSRRQARATLCGANIRDLLLDLHSYEAANQSLPHGFDSTRQVPPPGGYAGNALLDMMGWWWFDFIGAVRHRSLRELKILECPSKRQEDRMLDQSILCGNYGANFSLCKSTSKPIRYPEEFVGSPLPSSSIRHPGATLLLVDSGYGLIAWLHAAPEPPVTLGNSVQDAAYIPGMGINKDKQLWAGQKEDAITGRHPHKNVNVGYADGHVSRVQADELLVDKTGDDEWDASPLWRPD